jgi:polyhydroxybutyrate depolymerase
MRYAASIVTALLTLAISTCASAAGRDVTADRYGGRDMLVYIPSALPPAGSRALVIVLHGGLGNARRIATQQSERALNMNSVAESNGFIVAYLNGTPVTRFLGDQVLGWNAGGGCCGQSAQNKVDDVAYIRGAVGYLVAKYGVDPARVFGIGHSNGAMMTQRIVCETTLYAAGVAISGPLNLHIATCPAARGRRILAIHGGDDENVPVAGGQGARGLAHVAYVSEDVSRKVFLDSGAAYTLDIVPGADHMLDHIEVQIEKTDGVTVAQKAARFFGILKPGS